MADPNTINLAGNLPMEDQIAQQQINRQQQMAQLLMQPGQQQPQGPETHRRPLRHQGLLRGAGEGQ